ncbi:MAG: 5-formyltetrahydrofolate cyclo-ligase [Verrucomicrobiota bacterium]
MSHDAAKPRLRREARARLRDLSPAARDKAARRIQDDLASGRFFAEGKTVGLFAALPSEPATEPIFQTARERGCRVALPRMLPGGGLELYRVEDWSRDLEANAHGIAEPRPEGGRLVPPGEVDLLCAPGLGFDRAGHRLGRGGGDYDRLLATVRPDCLRLGLFFAIQEFDALPAEAHDQMLHAVLTENGLITVSRTGHKALP